MMVRVKVRVRVRVRVRPLCIERDLHTRVQYEKLTVI